MLAIYPPGSTESRILLRKSLTSLRYNVPLCSMIPSPWPGSQHPDQGEVLFGVVKKVRRQNAKMGVDSGGSCTDLVRGRADFPVPEPSRRSFPRTQFPGYMALRRFRRTDVFSARYVLGMGPVRPLASP